MKHSKRGNSRQRGDFSYGIQPSEGRREGRRKGGRVRLAAGSEWKCSLSSWELFSSLSCSSALSLAPQHHIYLILMHLRTPLTAAAR